MSDSKKLLNVSALYEALAVNNGLPVPVECLGPAFTTEAMLQVLVRGGCLREIGGRLWVNVVRLGNFLDTGEAGRLAKAPGSGSPPSQALDF